MSNPTPAAPPAKAGGGKKSIYIGLAVVLAIAGGGGGYWWSTREVAAEPEAKKEVSAHDRGMVSFDPFVVNLADANQSRFLRVTVRLVVESAEAAKELQEVPVALMQARSAILELLTTQTSDVLVTAEGKVALRASIKEHVTHAAEVEVVDVLFSDFVVQF